MNDLSVYIHIPFCQSICPFCDFTKLKSTPSHYDAYVDACLQEMHAYRPFVEGKRLQTVFFGGGTPSVMPTHYLERLLQGVKAVFSCSELREISVEMNPEDVTVSYLRQLNSIGVTRLSIGIQSFIDQECQFLGRVHSVEQSHKALEYVNLFEFQWSVDLIYALPNSTVDTLAYSLKSALDYNPGHVSCYSLTIEPGTPFYKNHVQKASNENDYDQFCYLQSELPSKGYGHYEISSFARPEEQCRHNSRYWSFRDYIGIGLGAHSLFEGARFHNQKQLNAYLENPISRYCDTGIEALDRETHIKEHIIANFRVPGGIVFADYMDRYGFDFFKEYKSVLDDLCAQGLCEYSVSGVWPTKKGLYFLDDICVSFF